VTPLSSRKYTGTLGGKLFRELHSHTSYNVLYTVRRKMTLFMSIDVMCYSTLSLSGYPDKSIIRLSHVGW
jgi:hypothetical protein